MSSNPPLPIKGEVRQIKERTEGTKHIWTFWLDEAEDANGNSLPRTSVEMRGGSFNGVLNEGETVRVDGKWRRGILKSRRVFNETTNSWFEVSTAYTLQIIAAIVGGILFLVVSVGILLGGPRMCQKVNEPPSLALPVTPLPSP